MKRILYTSALLIFSSPLFAQLPEDALRMGWINQSGTARQQAIGGAMTGLGGEISAAYSNPAGLGLYKTSEFVLSPGFSFLGGKGSFRGSTNKADALNRFNYGTSGFVFGFRPEYSKWSSKAIGLTINRTASFDRTTYYKGQNDYSSFAEPLANEFANSRLTIDQALNNNNISLLTKMALYTYLVDTATVGGFPQVIARSEQAGIVDQEQRVISKGGINELALTYAANMDDKFYFGVTFGVPIVNYSRTSFWKESDANGTGNNEFSYSSYSETYTSKGLGINGKLGILFKPAEKWRFGLAVHTPSLYGLKDKLSAEMTTDIDTATGSVKVFNVKSSELYGGTDPQFSYDLSSPWRFMGGITYILHEVEDVEKQKGFITADVEYITYGNPRFRTADQSQPSDLYKDVNTAVKESYKGAFNFRAGGELKFKVIMARLGFAYLTNPYKDKALKANRMNISGGLGYRDKGFFMDLTYIYSIQNDVNIPYRVDFPRFNTFANLKDRAGNVMLTFGVKF